MDNQERYKTDTFTTRQEEASNELCDAIRELAQAWGVSEDVLIERVTSEAETILSDMLQEDK